MTSAPAPRINDPGVVRREYASEHRFLARRLAAWAELEGPSVEDGAIAALREGASKPRAILEVGCGTGDYSARVVRELDVTLIALDLSARMAELAHGYELDALVGDVEHLPFPQGAFDAVLANRVLYHVPDLGRGLRETDRVLAPGRPLVAVTYSAGHLHELWDVLGTSPFEASFAAETGAALLAPYFDHVERRDFTGRARFASTTAIENFLEAYGEFSAIDLAARVGTIETPFDATYHHALFVASNRTP